MERPRRKAVKWQEFRAAPIQVAVNVSPIQFNSETIVEDICRTSANVIEALADVMVRKGVPEHLR